MDHFWSKLACFLMNFAFFQILVGGSCNGPTIFVLLFLLCLGIKQTGKKGFLDISLYKPWQISHKKSEFWEKMAFSGKIRVIFLILNFLKINQKLIEKVILFNLSLIKYKLYILNINCRAQKCLAWQYFDSPPFSFRSCFACRH